VSLHHVASLPEGVNLHLQSVVVIVNLKSKYVPFAFIVVDIDAESLGSVANEIDVTPVNVM
jgi:hypothetical protein